MAAEEASRKTSRLRKAKRLQVNSVRTIERFYPEMLNEDALPASSLAELGKDNFESSARRPRETAGRLRRTCNGVPRPSPRKDNSTYTPCAVRSPSALKPQNIMLREMSIPTYEKKTVALHIVSAYMISGRIGINSATNRMVSCCHA